MSQELSNDEIVNGTIKEMREIFLPEFAKILDTIDLNELLDYQPNPIYDDPTMRLWIIRFIKDEIDRLKEMNENSTDEAVKVELARILHMKVIDGLYEHLKLVFKKKITEKIEECDDVENT